VVKHNWVSESLPGFPFLRYYVTRGYFLKDGIDSMSVTVNNNNNKIRELHNTSILDSAHTFQKAGPVM
jgi:hypothetical protein